MEHSNSNSNKLPATTKFNHLDDDRVVQGVILRCVDGHWSCTDDSDPPAQFVVLDTSEALQRWEDQMPVETIRKTADEPLPDVAELNAAIPQDEWEDGIDGTPRPPWQHQFVAYLLDPKDASIYTYLNSTTGARIAVERLQSRMRWMQALRGVGVKPIVTLGSRPMKTKFGKKERPEFVIEKWVALDGNGGAAVETPQLTAVKEPTRQEDLKDEIRF